MRRLVLVVVVALVTGGCGARDDLATTSRAAMNPNAMNPNAMNPNAMNPNAMNPNALDPGALADPLARELLRYEAGCALRPDQAIEVEWTDEDGEHHDSYPGLLGLAPEWEDEPLDLAGQQWISDCLASRVNALGESVMLSSRGAHPALATTYDERVTYATREGAFFGNLFGQDRRVYACYDPLTSTLAQLQSRVCASNGSITSRVLNGMQVYDCGAITVVGPCLPLGWLTIGACQHVAWPDRYFYDCATPEGTAYPSVTTFVHGLLPF